MHHHKLLKLAERIMRKQKTHIYDVEYAYQSQFTTLPVDAVSKRAARVFVEMEYEGASVLNVKRRKRV